MVSFPPGRPQAAVPSALAARAAAGAPMSSPQQQLVAATTPDQRRRVNVGDFVTELTCNLFGLVQNRADQAFAEIVGDARAATAAQKAAEVNAAFMDVALEHFMTTLRAPTLLSPQRKTEINTMLAVAFTTAEGLGESLGGTMSIFPSNDDIFVAGLDGTDQLMAQSGTFFEQVAANIDDPNKPVDPFVAPEIPVYPIPVTPFPPDGDKATAVESDLQVVNSTLDDQLRKIRNFRKDILEREAPQIRRAIAGAQAELKRAEDAIKADLEGLNNILPAMTKGFMLGVNLLGEKVRATLVALDQALTAEVPPVEPDVEAMFRARITPILQNFQFKLTGARSGNNFVMRVSFTPDAEDGKDFIDDTLGTAATEIEEKTGFNITVERDFNLIPEIITTDVRPGPPPSPENAALLVKLAEEGFVISDFGQNLNADAVRAGIADRSIDADEADKLIRDAEFNKKQQFLAEQGIKAPEIGQMPDGVEKAVLDAAVAKCDTAAAEVLALPPEKLPSPFGPGMVPSLTIIPKITRG